MLSITLDCCGGQGPGSCQPPPSSPRLESHSAMGACVSAKPKSSQQWLMRTVMRFRVHSGVRGQTLRRSGGCLLAPPDGGRLFSDPRGGPALCRAAGAGRRAGICEHLAPVTAEAGAGRVAVGTRSLRGWAGSSPCSWVSARPAEPLDAVDALPSCLYNLILASAATFLFSFSSSSLFLARVG